MTTETFVIKRNDTLPALQISIATKGNLGQKTGYNLSGVTGITFTMIDDCNNCKVNAQTAQIICSSGGTIQYNWQSGDTDESGVYQGEFELNYADGSRMSIPPIGGIRVEIIKDLNPFN
jgi:hypothetical protein